MEDFTDAVILSDERQVILEDEDEIAISLVLKDNVKNIFRFACPSGGYGGGSLLLSPSEKYLIFSYFSGESEEAFALFKIEEDYLKLLYDSKYLYGEDANYNFMDHEKFLIQTVRTGSWYKDEAQTDENGDRYYEFGELNIFNLESCKLERHTILVYPSDDWTEEETDAGSFFISDMIDGKLLNVKMPWGSETFHYPLQDTLVIKCK